MLSILHFMSNPCGHHDFLLHISLNIGRAREIHWYSDDLHHKRFISMALFFILVKIYFLQLVAGICCFAGEDGGFHHHHHVCTFVALGSPCHDLILFIHFKYLF